MSRPGLRRRIGDPVVAALVVGSMKLAQRLPDRLAWIIGNAAGNVAYRLAPARRDRARRNLRRVVCWMAERNVGAESFRRASTDEKALEALVHSAFRHNAHYYLELARASRFCGGHLEELLVNETPEATDEALNRRRALILIGLHFGPIELPGFIAVNRAGGFVAPMESLSNARIQSYMIRTRSAMGVRILTLEEAGHELLAALRRDEPIGLIADRDITGGGLPVQLFGATARIPAGPALLAVETGAPVYVAGVHRTGPGRYRGNLRPLPAPVGASRRERSRSMAQEEALQFERIIAEAPDQWLAVFHPIWPDLEEAAQKGPA